MNNITKYPELHLPGGGVMNNWHKLAIYDIFDIQLVLADIKFVNFPNRNMQEALLKLEDNLYYNVYQQAIVNIEGNLNLIDGIDIHTVIVDFHTPTREEYVHWIYKGFKTPNYYEQARKDILEPKFMNIFIDIFQDYISKDVKKIIDVTLNTNHKM